MRVDDVKLFVSDNSYTGRLNTPDEPSGTGILLLPGAGHGPYGDVFDRFAEAASTAGHHVARFETWENQDELAEKTERELHDEIDAGIEFLRVRDCSTIVIVAKSFGARLALTHVPDEVDRMVLWAPAILFGESEDARSITPEALAEIDVPVRILQGDDDPVVSVANAASLAEHLPRGELVELPGEDHSFTKNQERVVEQTISFLPD